MNNVVDISFIVIGKNEGERLKICLRAVDKTIKSYPKIRFEVIYVDSKSTDGSIENVHKEFPAVKVFLVTGDCSAAIGRNIGGKEAIGEIFIFLDGDMEFQSDFLATILDDNNHLKYPFCNGIGCNYNYTPDWQFINKTYVYKVEKDTYFDTSGGFFVIESKYWRELGGMDNRFVINEDIDFSKKMFFKGIRVLKYASVSDIHHTIPYNIRNNMLWFSVRNQRYPMVIVREHLFDKLMIKHNLIRLAMPFLFLLTVILSIVFRSIWLWIPYLLVSIIRTIRFTKVNIGYKLISNILCDISQLLAFFFFFPKKKEEKYVVA